MTSTPNAAQQVISRDELMEKLKAVLQRHPVCHGYHIDKVQVFAPGMIMGSNWRISPPLDASGEREHSPCWLAIVKDVRELQQRYKLPWP